MKEALKRIIYLLVIVVAVASCSTPRYASAQDDGYSDNNNSNNDNSYNNNDYNNNQGYNNNQSNNNDDANNYYDEPSSVNVNTFNDALTPYGSWVVSASYGRCWIPHSTGFVPYSTGGRWVYSSYGWTWASDYSWGWAPFHYGRWAYDPFYGWMWAPGYQWGPAWVTWRSGGGYYGWSPLGPGMSVGINIGFGIPYNQWVFAPCRYMGYGNINHYYVRPSYNTTIIHNTTIINNTTVYNNRTFVAGPNRVEVERFSGRQVNQVRVVNAATPGRTVINSNNTIQMYRPGVVQRLQANNQGAMQDNANRNNQYNQQNQLNRGNNVQDDRSAQQINTPQRNMPSPDARDVINNNHRLNDFADRQQRPDGDQQQAQPQRNTQQNQLDNMPQHNQQNMPSQDQQDRMRNLQQQQQQINRSNNDQQQQQKRTQNNPPQMNDQNNGRGGRQQDFNQQQQKQQNFNQQQQPSYRQPQQQGGGNEKHGKRD